MIIDPSQSEIALEIRSRKQQIQQQAVADLEPHFGEDLESN
jgi:hypothetical protein